MQYMKNRMVKEEESKKHFKQEYLKEQNNMTNKTFSAVLYKEEKIYVAECSEVGTISQGYTVEESLANLKEATELYLEEFPLKENL